jgi:hypothetical protein
MLHRNCHTRKACSSNENFSISKGKTCHIHQKIGETQIYYWPSVSNNYWIICEIWLPVSKRSFNGMDLATQRASRSQST